MPRSVHDVESLQILPKTISMIQFATVIVPELDAKSIPSNYETH